MYLLTFQGGQWVLDLVDFFGGGFIIYILAIIETIGIFFIYGEGTVDIVTVDIVS